jgi:hypothetical protein
MVANDAAEDLCDAYEAGDGWQKKARGFIALGRQALHVLEDIGSRKAGEPDLCRLPRLVEAWEPSQTDPAREDVAVPDKRSDVVRRLLGRRLTYHDVLTARLKHDPGAFPLHLCVGALLHCSLDRNRAA